MFRSPLPARLCRWLGAFVLAASTALPALAAIPATERQVLIDLYNSTNGDGWTNSTGWKTGGVFSGAGTECSWRGITCDAGKTYVTEINLDSNQLTNTLPPSLNQLTGLERFVVEGNQLTGPIPSLNGLTALRDFNVAYNQLDSPIPPLSGLPALTFFAAFSNQLTGPIPSLTGLMALRSFYVGWNRLTGSIPSLSGLAALEVFSAHDNQLSGPIPSLSGLTTLTQFYASGNQLSGPVPSLSGLTALQAFEVDRNQLSGTIPSLSGLTALSSFEAQRNQLTGPIPSLDGLPVLRVFHVANNQLTGAPPAPPDFLVSDGEGSLCPNHLTQVPSADWDAITSATPWSADCTAAPTYTVTFNAGAGTVTPPASGYTGGPGATPAFGITAPAGQQVAQLSSTCGVVSSQPPAVTPGPLTSFTTLPLIADCQIDVSYSALPVNGACGSAHGTAVASAPRPTCAVPAAPARSAAAAPGTGAAPAPTAAPTPVAVRRYPRRRRLHRSPPCRRWASGA